MSAMRGAFRLCRQLPVPLVAFATQQRERLQCECSPPKFQKTDAEFRNPVVPLRYAVPARARHSRDLRQEPNIEIGEYEQVTTTIRDGRGVRLKLDETAFEFREGEPTALSTDEFYMGDARIQDAYYPEIKALLSKMLGTPHVLIWNHIVRSAQKEGPLSGAVDGVRGYAHHVHTDMCPFEADVLFKKFVSQLPEECRGGRYVFLNVWRSIGDEPVEDNPLAVLDERSVVKPDDYCETEYLSPEPTCPHALQYTLSNRNAQLHKWYYFSRMTRNDVLVFKQFDSDPSCTGRFCFHTAFQDPTSRQGCPKRQSIDVRALVCFPAQKNTCPL